MKCCFMDPRGLEHKDTSLIFYTHKIYSNKALTNLKYTE